MNAKFRQLIGALALSIFVLSFAASASPTEEISLFDYKGRPVAYIAEDRTIYLWEGKPVAYIYGENTDVFDVYGFNGKHIGWFKSLNPVSIYSNRRARCALLIRPKESDGRKLLSES